MAKNKKPDYAADGDTVTVNRKARFDYAILEKFEAGIELMGTEVKSVRLANASLVDAHADITHGQVWLHNAFIAQYKMGDRMGRPDERRPRRLLMHRHEIDRLEGKLETPGTTLVPLSIYFKNGRAKVELALARGKKAHDKRHAIQEREQHREMGRLRKEYDVR